MSVSIRRRGGCWPALLWLAVGGTTSGAALAQDAAVAACLQGEVEITTSTRLAPGCRHAASLLITRSGVTLDCQGGTIDVGGRWNFGILVDSRGEPLENVTIANCRITDARVDGVRIAWTAPDRQKDRRYDHAELYARTPQRVQLNDLRISGSGRSGLYVDDYVQETQARRLDISGSGDVGVYLEHSSRATVIEDSSIHHNGARYSREGIAIDSSANNRIVRNKIFSNATAGIMVYRNCGEHLRSDPNEVIRWQSADHNVIESNEFSDMKVGVWIASRQSADLSKSECGLGYYAEGRYSMDSAKYNRVVGNRFTDIDYGVIVEDDFNEVTGNRFERIRQGGIRVGSKPLFDFTGRAVKGNRVSGNQFSDGKSDVRFIGGAENAQ